MNEHLAINHAIALKQKLYWQKERDNLGKLCAPRTDWMLSKFTRLEASLWSQLQYHIESVISTQKLYDDLGIQKQTK